ncbi:MAG: MFS transporter, partial [Pseudomonadota bacterium]
MNDADILDSRYSWTRLGLALALSLVGNVGMWVIIVMLPDIQAEFDVNRADASLPYTLMMLGFATGNMVFGRVVDRFGVTTAMMIAAVMVSAGMVASAISPTIGILSL